MMMIIWIHSLQLVGWIFAQSSEERDFIVSVEELKQMAAMQSEHGETAVTAIVSLDMSENEGQVHFEVISKNPPVLLN